MDDTVLTRKQRAAKRARGNRKMKPFVRKKQTTHEPINADEMYSFDLVGAKFGIGRTSLRKAQREGMPTHLFGHKKWVRGSALIDFLTKQ